MSNPEAYLCKWSEKYQKNILTMKKVKIDMSQVPKEFSKNNRKKYYQLRNAMLETQYNYQVHKAFDEGLDFTLSFEFFVRTHKEMLSAFGGIRNVGLMRKNKNIGFLENNVYRVISIKEETKPFIIYSAKYKKDLYTMKTVFARRNTPERSYNLHIKGAKDRGIDFKINFSDWWSCWKPFFYLKDGCRNYHMCRTADTGAYEVGNVRIDTLKGNVIEALAKHYIGVSPEGKVRTIYNLREFCREQKLNIPHAYSVANGKRNYTGGWTFRHTTA